MSRQELKEGVCLAGLCFVLFFASMAGVGLALISLFALGNRLCGP